MKTTSNNSHKSVSKKGSKIDSWFGKGDKKIDKDTDFKFTILTESDLKAKRNNAYEYILP